MEKLLNVSSSPHVRSKVSTQSLMLDVIIAMIPASVFGVWHFGMNAALVLSQPSQPVFFPSSVMKN